MHKICEKDVKTLFHLYLIFKYRIENSISDKPPLYWTYIRKGTVSQYIQVTRCIAKTLRTYAYMQPSLILMFPSFYIVTTALNLIAVKATRELS